MDVLQVALKSLNVTSHLRNNQTHLPEFLYVSIKRERQRESEGREQDHKVTLCEYVIWTDCKHKTTHDTSFKYILHTLCMF